jgi:hypothetical protein
MTDDVFRCGHRKADAWVSPSTGSRRCRVCNIHNRRARYKANREDELKRQHERDRMTGRKHRAIR